MTGMRNRNDGDGNRLNCLLFALLVFVSFFLLIYLINLIEKIH